MKTFKKLSAKLKMKYILEVKLMLAAHRDGLWNRWETCSSAQAVDPTKWQVVAMDSCYGEAFGIMRGALIEGRGYFGSDTADAVEEGRSNVPEHNLKWWFRKIQNEYLDEEGFFNGTCSQEKCLELLQKYRLLVRK